MEEIEETMTLEKRIETEEKDMDTRIAILAETEKSLMEYLTRSYSRYIKTGWAQWPSQIPKIISDQVREGSKGIGLETKYRGWETSGFLQLMESKEKESKEEPEKFRIYVRSKYTYGIMPITAQEFSIETDEHGEKYLKGYQSIFHQGMSTSEIEKGVEYLTMLSKMKERLESFVKRDYETRKKELDQADNIIKDMKLEDIEYAEEAYIKACPEA